MFGRRGYTRRVLVIPVLLVIIFAISSVSEETDIPVLNYHRVKDNVFNPLTLSNEEFEEQMQYLHAHGYHSITPDQLLMYLQTGEPLPDKPVLITFDDGYRDNYVNAYPILKKYGFTATIFLITDVVGHDYWYLDWEQVREMQQAGFVFGSHTLSHIPLTTMGHDEATFQLLKSKEGMEWRLHTPVNYFAYPNGEYNRDAEALVKRLGYKAAFSTDFGRVNAKSDVYALERIPIFKSRHPFANFYLRLNFTTLTAKLKNVIRPFRTPVHDENG